MKSKKKTTSVLEDPKVNAKIKLSALWATVMFLFLYVDVFGLYKPGVIEEIIAGKIWKFEITQAWALGSLVLMTIPSLMVFLSLGLKAKANRWINLIAGFLYVVVVVGNTIGEAWAFYIFGSFVELGLLSMIIWTAWKWPRQQV